MLTQDQIATIDALIESAGSTFLAIEAVKADGTLRVFQTQLAARKNHVVDEYESDSREQAVITRHAKNPDLRNIWDTAKQRWSCFDITKVVSVAVRGERHVFGGVPA